MNEFIRFFIPTFSRLVLISLSIYIYYNTYKKISAGIIPVLLFPSFYIVYMVIKYPENLNWKNDNPTVPGEGSIIDELNYLIQNKYTTVTLFIPLYLIITSALYKKQIAKIYNYFKIRSRVKK